MTTWTCQYCEAATTPEGPCRACGDTGRIQHSTGQAALSVGIGIVTEFVATYNLDVSWVDIWIQVRRRIDRIGEMYQAERLQSNLEVQDEVDACMVACYHIGDWLRNDDINLPQIDDQIVWDYLAKSSMLSVCQDYANTYKHLTRDATKRNPTPGYARIRAFTGAAGNNSVEVGYWTDQNAVSRIDALVFLNECMDEWRSLLSHNGIAEPQ